MENNNRDKKIARDEQDGKWEEGEFGIDDVNEYTSRLAFERLPLSHTNSLNNISDV